MAEASHLRFAPAAGGRTHVAGHRVVPPLAFTRGFHLDDEPPGLCTVVLQSTSGALLPGEPVALDVDAAAGAQAHVTAQGATVVHGGGPTAQRLTVRAAAGSLLEVLLPPAILLPGADLTSRLAVDVGPGAVVLVQDAYSAYDPTGSGATFRRLATEVMVTGAGRVRCADRTVLGGADPSLASPAVLGASAHHAAMFLLGVPDGWAGLVRCALGGATAGLSRLPAGAGLGVKVLARDAAVLRTVLHQVWVAVRIARTGHAPADLRWAVGRGR